MTNRQPSATTRARTSARPVRPPQERGTWKAFAIAALMHVLLGILLYHGVNWQNSTPAGAEAELWTDIPDVPAPRTRPVPPPPPVKAQPAHQKAKKQAEKQADKQKQLAQQKLDQQKAEQAKEKEADAAKAAQQDKQDADAKAKAGADP